MSRPGLLVGAAALGVALVLLSPSCSGPADPVEPLDLSAATSAAPHRLLVIGVDGLDPVLLQEMMDRGELPNIQALVKRGTGGPLETLEPTLSPVIWTTIATGVSPERHGITGFTRKNDRTGEDRLFTSKDRKVQAVWNMASRGNRRVAVVGWWTTWPAEPVNGVVVSQYSDLQQSRKVWKGSVLEEWPAQTWPEEFFEEILPMVQDVYARWPDEIPAGAAVLPAAVRQVLPGLPEGSTDYDRRLAGDSLWAWRADVAYARLGSHVLETRHPDLAMIYLGSPDVAGHRFFRHFRPELYENPPRPEAVAEFQDVIPATYRLVDGMIGEMTAAAGPETAVMVISDHGMVAINTGGDFAAMYRDSGGKSLSSVLAGHHRQGEPGVLIAAGGPFRSDGRETLAPEPVGSVADMAPTLLYLLGMPVGEDLDGRVLTGLLKPGSLADRPVAFVPTYETGLESDATEGDETQALDEERMRQLRSLGYIE